MAKSNHKIWKKALHMLMCAFVCFHALLHTFLLLCMLPYTFTCFNALLHDTHHSLLCAFFHFCVLWHLLACFCILLIAFMHFCFWYTFLNFIKPSQPSSHFLILSQLSSHFLILSQPLAWSNLYCCHETDPKLFLFLLDTFLIRGKGYYLQLLIHRRSCMEGMTRC